MWIPRDLWERIDVEIADCYLASEDVKWSGTPAKLRFAEDIWGKGVKESFASKLKAVVAGTGRGGCGPLRPRSPEEGWNNWGDGWNYLGQHPPPPYFSPPIGPPMPPIPPMALPGFGYFPDHHPPYLPQGQQM